MNKRGYPPRIRTFSPLYKPIGFSRWLLSLLRRGRFLKVGKELKCGYEYTIIFNYDDEEDDEDEELEEEFPSDDDNRGWEIIEDEWYEVLEVYGLSYWLNKYNDRGDRLYVNFLNEDMRNSSVWIEEGRNGEWRVDYKGSIGDYSYRSIVDSVKNYLVEEEYMEDYDEEIRWKELLNKYLENKYG